MGTPTPDWSVGSHLGRRIIQEVDAVATAPPPFAGLDGRFAGARVVAQLAGVAALVGARLARLAPLQDLRRDLPPLGRFAEFYLVLLPGLSRGGEVGAVTFFAAGRKPMVPERRGTRLASAGARHPLELPRVRRGDTRMMSEEAAVREIVDSQRVRQAEQPAIQRPSFRWTDLWKAPLHDFPIRDEILFQFLPLCSTMEALEIGPGSGFTAFRLSRQVQRLTLVDVTHEAIEQVRRQIADLKNVRCVCADVTEPRLADALKAHFDLAFALDVFEYLSDPITFFRNMAEVLRPSGQLFVTYPNVPPPVGDGVTYFARMEELSYLLERAGFRNWLVFAVRLYSYPAAIYRALHEWPRGLYRRLHKRDGSFKPQTYEATWAFKNRQRLLPYKVPLHLFWVGLQRLVRLTGDVFQAEPVAESIAGRQLVIRAWV